MKLLSASQNTEHVILFFPKSFDKIAVSVPNGLSGETRTHGLVIPNHVIYQLIYTQMWWSRGESNPCPKSLHGQDLLTQYTVSQRSPYGGNYVTVKRHPRTYNGLYVSTTLFLYPVIRKTAKHGVSLTSDAYPTVGTSFWRSKQLLGCSPLSRHSGKSGVDHDDSISLVIYFLIKP